MDDLHGDGPWTCEQGPSGINVRFDGTTYARFWPDWPGADVEARRLVDDLNERGVVVSR